MCDGLGIFSTTPTFVACACGAATLAILHASRRRSCTRRRPIVKPVVADFGAEVQGVDLREGKHSDADIQLIIDAFYRSGGLLLIRGQENIRPKDLCKFANKFGALELNEKYLKRYLLPGFEEILRVGNLRGEDGEFDSLFVQAQQRPLLWHADDSFRSPQPLGSILYCVEAPEFADKCDEQVAFANNMAAATWFADCTAAYAALPASRKDSLSGLVAVHDYNYLNEILMKSNPHRPPLSAEMRRQLPPVQRPLVSVHPKTGRESLCAIPCHISHVIGPEYTCKAALQGELGWETLEAPGAEAAARSKHLVDDSSDLESGRQLVSELMDFATQKEFTYGHLWRKGDLVLWDNRCTLHSPTPFDTEKKKRLMYRLTITAPKGE